MLVYKIRDCHLNTSERRVLKNGQYIDLTTRAFDILQLLVERRGEIVTKDDILDNVWNDSFVEEGNLAVHISKLRRALGESKSQPFIETVQGSGYRFVAPAYEIDENEWERLVSNINRTAPQKAASSEWAFDSIAVMPLEIENEDTEMEYLADGLTESFINNLSRLPNLKVIARNTVFRYKNKNIDPCEIGKTFDTRTVMTGRLRTIKDRLILSLELTKTKDGTQLWGTHYNCVFTDIFEIEERVVSEVFEKLKSEITGYSKENSTITKDFESYRFYLKGKYLLDKWTEDSIYKAIECFERSIVRDPLNLYSYVEIVECYFMLYFCDYISYLDVQSKVKPLLMIISRMDQEIDVIQAMFAGKKMYLDWKFDEAEQHLQNALQINPNCLIARYRYSNLLLHSGRLKESLEELHRIGLIDPLSVINRIRIGRTLYKMQRFENAMFYLKEALELDPENYIALDVLSAVLVELGDFEEALKLAKSSLNSHFNVETLSFIGYIYAVKGDKIRAYEIIDQMNSLKENNSHSGFRLAKIYCGLGEKSLACDLLEDAYDKHDVDLISLKYQPIFVSLHDEPRFKELLLKIGVTDELG